ncbi:hypothetical protein KW507_15840 [Vibrio fluvialis]|nr:hypothetical protein [Vibrio fluvialis]
MVIVKNMSELNTLDKSELKHLVLGGDLTNCVVFSTTNSTHSSDRYIRQTPLKLGANVVQAELDTAAVQFLQERKIKAVVIADYVYIRAVQSYIRSKRRYNAYFVSDENVFGTCYITLVQFSDGKIAQIRVRRDVPSSEIDLMDALDQAVESDLNAEWQSAQVLVFASSSSNLGGWAGGRNNVELVEKDLFTTNRLGLGKFAMKEILLSKHYKNKSSRRLLVKALTLCTIMATFVGGSFGWLSWKEGQLEHQREKYRQASEMQNLAFESGDLELWVKREEYLTMLEEAPKVSDKIEQILMALSSMNSEFKVVVHQISIGSAKDFRSNGKYYNTKIVVGFEKKTANSEHDVAQALSVFMEKIGNALQNVDVWDRVQPRKINNNEFNMVTLYTNTTGK